MKTQTLLKVSILSTILVTSVAIQPLNAAENVIRDYTLRDLSTIIDEKNKIKAMDAGDPYGTAVEKALDLANAEATIKKDQANKATELAQNAEVAKAIRAEQEKSKSRSDAILKLDPSFSLFIRSLLDYRNRLTICPHMIGLMNQPVLPYGYYVKDADYDASGLSSLYSARLTSEDDAAGLQLAAFTLTALLSQLKADLDAPKPNREKIKQSFNAVLQQAKDMTKLLRSTEEYSYLSIFDQVIKGAYGYDPIKRTYGYDGLDAKINNVKKAIQDADAIADANEKDKAIGKLFDTFLGGLAAVGVQAAGTAAGDPMVGMTAGSAASEFGSSVGNLISGPIIKNNEIQRQHQQREKYGSLGAFNSASLTLLATSMELGKQLFQELWITQWENTADNLVKDCVGYLKSLRSEVDSKLQNLTIAREVDQATAINNVFVDIIARVQNLVDDISTVRDIAEDESLANYSSAFSLMIGTSEAFKLQNGVKRLQDNLKGPKSLDSLLNSLFKDWQGDDKKELQGFQAASADIESIKGSYSIDTPNTAEDNDKLEKAIARITTIKSNIAAIYSYLCEALYPSTYPSTLKTFYEVADSLRKMANDEIKNANMALVKVAPLIVGDMVANEQNLLMVLSTNTLSVSLATQWAQAMRDKHSQYTGNLSLDSLSLVIQYAFSTNTDGRIRAYNYMTQSYPQFAELGDYKVIAPMLSTRISNTFSLLSRLPTTETDVTDTIAQMKADIDNLNSWIDTYVADAKTYLNT